MAVHAPKPGNSCPNAAQRCEGLSKRIFDMWVNRGEMIAVGDGMVWYGVPERWEKLNCWIFWE